MKSKEEKGEGEKLEDAKKEKEGSRNRSKVKKWQKKKKKGRECEKKTKKLEMKTNEMKGKVKKTTTTEGCQKRRKKRVGVEISTGDKGEITKKKKARNEDQRDGKGKKKDD